MERPGFTLADVNSRGLSLVLHRRKPAVPIEADLTGHVAPLFDPAHRHPADHPFEEERIDRRRGQHHLLFHGPALAAVILGSTACRSSASHWRVPPRAGDITIADLTGLAAQDIAIAGVVCAGCSADPLGGKSQPCRLRPGERRFVGWRRVQPRGSARLSGGEADRAAGCHGVTRLGF